MIIARSNPSQATLISLEAAAASARSGFACLFSTSDEFETALISQRRAQGRYASPRSPALTMLFIGCSLVVAGVVLLTF